MVQATAPIRGVHQLLRFDAKAGALRERKFQLAVLTGARAGAKVVLDENLVIGSGEQAGLALEDGTLSRLHLELVPKVEGVWVRDLGSTNGTYVGGVRIKEALVESEAVVLAGMTRLRISVDEAELALPETMTSFGEALGHSVPMRRLFGVLDRVARTDSSVILEGETGTGKEVLARALHQASHRAEQPFVVVDCASVSAELVESELFGHCKGAFTGAVTSRDGAFQQADGGTLFLDEVDELPLDLQPRLLRALETGLVRRVGDDRERSVDLRVVAATRANLEEEVRQGRFRQDLYFRLAVVPLQVPALRERVEDIPQLARHFVDLSGRGDVALPPAFLTRLTQAPWPGNVRQLRNVLERALTLHPTTSMLEELASRDLSELLGTRERLAERGDSSDDPERRRILEALEQSGGNQTVAAKLLGISRGTLASRLDQFGLPRPRKSH